MIMDMLITEIMDKNLHTLAAACIRLHIPNEL